MLRKEEFDAFVENQKQVARNKYATNSSVENIATLFNSTVAPLLEVHNPIFVLSTDNKEFGKLIVNKMIYQIIDSEQGRGLFIRPLYA
jgi:hypothetical protein